MFCSFVNNYSIDPISNDSCQYIMCILIVKYKSNNLKDKAQLMLMIHCNGLESKKS